MAILDFDGDRLAEKHGNWSIPLTRKKGHLYVEWPFAMHFIRNELRRMHWHFKRPSPDSLFATIRRAEPLCQRSNLLRDLEQVYRLCEVCQREAPPPNRFRSTLPNPDVVFNNVVCLEIMKIAQRSVLHAVDRATNFGAARLLLGRGSTTYETPLNKFGR